MSKPLKKLMKKVIASDAQEELAVSDAKLGNVIKVNQIYELISHLDIFVNWKLLNSKKMIVSLPENFYWHI